MWFPYDRASWKRAGDAQNCRQRVHQFCMRNNVSLEINLYQCSAGRSSQDTCLLPRCGPFWLHTRNLPNFCMTTSLICKNRLRVNGCIYYVTIYCLNLKAHQIFVYRWQCLQGMCPSLFEYLSVIHSIIIKLHSYMAWTCTSLQCKLPW